MLFTTTPLTVTVQMEGQPSEFRELQDTLAVVLQEDRARDILTAVEHAIIEKLHDALDAVVDSA